MSQFKKNMLILDHQFERQHKRHYLNGTCVVLHCHHYSTLYTQLALDAGETELLFHVAEDTFHRMLSEYLQQHKLVSLSDKIDIACQYYAAIGLGKMAIISLGNDSGEVVLEKSHVDQGWIKKWGTYDKPVNYITAGYIAALFSAVLDSPVRTFQVYEVESMVMGAEKSRFKIVRK